LGERKDREKGGDEQRVHGKSGDLFIGQSILAMNALSK
jgi:hypothetical protein